MSSSRTVVIVAILLVSSLSAAYNNGVGRTPPMGWNTWCTDDLCGLIDKCSDALVRQQAEAMVASGMHRLGYHYINMDDCWGAKERDAKGRLQPDATRFPYGMKALVDYVHSLGLKMGVYTCIGTYTCKNKIPGSFGHYKEDAETFAEWGLDFIKCDNCNKPSQYDEVTLYTNFSHWLNATGRPIFFSLCEWGNENVQAWGGNVGNMYRIQMDHLPFWDFPWPTAAGKGFGQGSLNIIEYIATLKPSTFVRPYAWMDPDFLMTMFWPTMSFTYSKSEFSFWALWSAPLIVSTDIFNMTVEKQSILLNEEVIAIDQDLLGVAGDRLANYSTGAEIWSKPLSNGDIAIILFNNQLNGPPINITVSWSQLGMGGARTIASVRDLWQHVTLGNFTGKFTASVKPADVSMLRLTCKVGCKKMQRRR